MPCEMGTPSWGSAGAVASAFPRSAGSAFEAASWGISSPSATELDFIRRFAGRADRAGRRTALPLISTPAAFAAGKVFDIMLPLDLGPASPAAFLRCAEGVGTLAAGRPAVDATLDRYQAFQP